MIKRGKKQPWSWQVLDSILKRGEAQELARRLSYSPQHVRALCRPPETDNEFSSGRLNDLDRLRTWVALVKDADGCPDRAYPIGEYVAGLLGGTFCPDISPTPQPDSDVLQQISAVLKETGEAIEATRQSWFVETPGRITDKERAHCTKQINEALVALSQMKAWLENIAE